MNKKLQSELEAYFHAPEPQRKEAFFHALPIWEEKPYKIFFSQISYIRKWVWVLQAAVFIFVLSVIRIPDMDLLWSVSAFMPFLAMAVITECGRSQCYGMAEFEMTAKFSLRQVVLSRLCILGISDFLLFCVVVPILFIYSEYTMLSTGIYLLVPYLLTAFLELYSLRLMQGKQSIYVYSGIALAISVLSILAHEMFPYIYGQTGFAWWWAALFLSGTGAAVQCAKMLENTEELVWSL